MEAESISLLFNLMLLTTLLANSIKESRTTLIPKIPNPTDPGQFRPIAVSSVLLRSFHKILTKRVSALNILTIRQKAFIPEDGCAINLVILQNLIKRAKTLASPLHLALLDTRKAFDSVSLNSIQFALRSKGLPEPFINYITSMYRQTCSTWVCGERISVKRGVRQGDPLSPFLFNIVLDLTLAMLGDRLGYKLENGAMLTHLVFADDVVLVSSSSTGL